LLASRFTPTCKRTGLSLVWRSSHRRLRPRRCWWDEHQRPHRDVRLLRLPGDAEGGERPAADLARPSGERVASARSSSLALALLVDQSCGLDP
jgi:hypothetical protein